jgi:hypothetical protein
LFVRRWINSVETNDIKAKTDFQAGMERLVDKGADDNGVWKMMVAASALHEIKSYTLNRSTPSTRIPRMEAFWAISRRTSAIWFVHDVGCVRL